MFYVTSFNHGNKHYCIVTPQALTPLMSDFYLLFNVQLFEVILAPKMHVLIDDFCKRCFKKTISYTQHEKMQLNIFDAKKNTSGYWLSGFIFTPA